MRRPASTTSSLSHPPSSTSANRSARLKISSPAGSMPSSSVPVDSKGIGPGVRKANEANVPVFTADNRRAGRTVVSHIASDNVAGGAAAGGVHREGV